MTLFEIQYYYCGDCENYVVFADSAEDARQKYINDPDICNGIEPKGSLRIEEVDASRPAFIALSERH